MKKKLITLGAVASISLFLFSCGTGGEDETVSSTSSKVAFYLTDKPKMDVDEVDITINKVEFLHTGRGNECVLFEYDPTAGEPNPLKDVNLLELQDSYLFVNETECEKAPYNRLRVDFDREVTVKKDGQLYTCVVEGFDRGKGKQPNRPHCVGESCYVELNGAVNVAANVENVGVDFDIKNSKIIIDNTGNCSIMFKLSPLHIDKEKFKAKRFKTRGFITDLDTENQEFTLHHGKREFTVNYSQVQQDNIDQILTFAENNYFDRRVVVDVKCFDFEKETRTCDAEEIKLILRAVQVENLDDINKTFQITLTDGQTITIDYSNADVDDDLENGDYVKVEINSATYNELDGTYIYNAKKIKVIEMDDEEMNENHMNDNNNDMDNDTDNDSDDNGMNNDQNNDTDNDSDNNGMNQNP